MLTIKVALVNLTSFNRTFMELKFLSAFYILIFLQVSIVPLWNWNCSKRGSSASCIRFQSYLYGIEICHSKHAALSTRPFQSYLYGIEIRIVEAFIQHLAMFQSYLYGIEIWRIYRRGSSLHRFQSYLYGIEIEFPLPHLHTRHYSFNRTFMELKLHQERRIGSPKEFQSYLYGIEIKQI